MVYGYAGGAGFHLSNPVITTSIGAGVGIVQDIVLASSAPYLGAPVAPFIGSNGDLVSLVTGLPTIILGIAGVTGHGGRWLNTHQNLSAGMAGYGVVTFGTFVGRKIVQAMGGTGLAARGSGDAARAMAAARAAAAAAGQHGGGAFFAQTPNQVVTAGLA